MNINKLLIDELENINLNEKNMIEFIFSEIDKNIDDMTIKNNILQKTDLILGDNNGIE